MAKRNFHTKSADRLMSDLIFFVRRRRIARARVAGIGLGLSPLRSMDRNAHRKLLLCGVISNTKKMLTLDRNLKSHPWTQGGDSCLHQAWR